MLAAELSGNCGLLPPGVAEVSIRCVDEDLFCWVLSEQLSNNRLLALPNRHDLAQSQLASTLEADHGFGPAQAALAAQTLFAEAFRGIEFRRDHGGPAVVDLIHAGH